MNLTDTQLDELKAFLDGALEEWAAEFITARAAFLRKRKIAATQELANSLEAEINQQARREVSEILISFSEHGRLVDMKSMQPPDGGAEYIQALIDWIKDKGLEQKFVETYMKRRRLKKVPERVLVYIAWGIARKRSTGKFRRRSWWNKAKTGAINDLFNQVAANLPEKIAQQITQQFNGNQTR